MTREEWRRHMVQLAKALHIIEGVAGRPLALARFARGTAGGAEWDEPNDRARAIADYREVLTQTIRAIRADLAKLDEADAILAALEVTP